MASPQHTRPSPSTVPDWRPHRLPRYGPAPKQLALSGANMAFNTWRLIHGPGLRAKTGRRSWSPATCEQGWQISAHFIYNLHAPQLAAKDATKLYAGHQHSSASAGPGTQDTNTRELSPTATATATPKHSAKAGVLHQLLSSSHHAKQDPAKHCSVLLNSCCRCHCTMDFADSLHARIEHSQSLHALASIRPRKASAARASRSVTHLQHLVVSTAEKQVHCPAQMRVALPDTSICRTYQ